MSLLTRASTPLPVSVPGSRRLDVQGLRALAVVLVVTSAAGAPAALGRAGNGIFLTVAIVVAALEPVALRRMVVRRLRRLLPALVVVLAVTLLGSFVLESPLGPQQATARSAAAAVAGLGDLVDGGAPLTHLWGWALLVQCSLLVAALRPVVPARLLLAVRRPRPTTGALALTAGAALAVVAGGAPAAGAAGAALVVAGGTLRDVPVSRVLGTRALTYVGDRAWCIWLWHRPVIVFASLAFPSAWTPPVAALAALAPAWLTHRYVEWRPSWAWGAPLVLGLAVLLGLGGVHAVPAAAALTRSPAAGSCLVAGRPFLLGDLDRCTFTAGRSRGWVLLAGDEHAADLETGLRGAAAGEGLDLVTVTGAGCPLARRAHSDSVPNCAAMNRTLLDRATGPSRPLLAVVAGDTPRATLGELHAAGVPVLLALDVPDLTDPRSPATTACRGGFLLFTCARPQADVERYQGVSRAAQQHRADTVPGVVVLDPWPAFCRTGTCDPVRNGRLAYRDDRHLNAVGSAALQPRLREALARIEPRSAP